MIRGWTPYAGTEPQFEASIDSVKATFRFKNTGKEIGGAIGGAIELTDRQKEIIKLIENNPKISYRKVAEILKINDSAAQAHFDALKNKGIIKREGSTRGYWKILNGD